MVTDALWDATLGRLLTSLGNALVDMFTLTMTWWLRPDLDPVRLGAGAIAEVGGIARTLAGAVLMLGLIGAGVRLAWRRDGSDLVEVAATVARFVLATTAGIAVISALLRLANELTRWIMPTAANTEISDPQIAWYVTSLAPATVTLVAAMPIVAVLLAVLFVGSTIAMFVAVLFRTASIIVLVVVLPIAAAGGATLTTRQWFPKVAGWLLALIFWRPVAALMYRIAAEVPQTSTDSNGGALQVLLVALTMMLLAVAALPAMMRLFSFATGSLGPGGGGMSTAVAAGSIGAEIVRVRGEAAVAQSQAAAGPSAAAGAAGPSAPPAAPGPSAPPGPGPGSPSGSPSGGPGPATGPTGPTGPSSAPPTPAAPTPGAAADAVARTTPTATGEPASTAVLTAVKTTAAAAGTGERAVRGAADDATPEQE